MAKRIKLARKEQTSKFSMNTVSAGGGHRRALAAARLARRSRTHLKCSRAPLQRQPHEAAREGRRPTVESQSCAVSRGH